MEPILFWILGVISVTAGLFAITDRKPLRSIFALIVLMVSNAMMLFVLSLPVLAIELLVVTLGAFSAVWLVLRRSGRLKLGTPGRKRFNITKFIAFFIALWLCVLLIGGVFHPRTASHWVGASQNAVGPVTGPEGELGGAMALLLLGGAVASSFLVVISRRRLRSEETS